MSDIYNEHGMLDYAEASRTLASLSKLTNAAMREAAVGQIKAAALVDIAYGLSMLTHNIIVIGEHLGAYEGREELAPDPEQDDEEPDEAPLELGDEVLVDGVDGILATIEAFGESEGDPYAVVAWPDGSTNKVWVAALSRPEAAPDAEESADEARPKAKGKHKSKGGA